MLLPDFCARQQRRSANACGQSCFPSPLPSPIRWARENHSPPFIKTRDWIRRTIVGKTEID
jgi:hypothetical protein